MKFPKKLSSGQTGLQRWMQSEERPGRFPRIECVFRLDRHARHSSGSGRPSVPFAALMRIHDRSKTRARIGIARLYGRSLSSGEQSRVEHNLTKSEVMLTTRNVVQMPVNTNYNAGHGNMVTPVPGNR